MKLPLEIEKVDIYDEHGGFTMLNSTEKDGQYSLWRPGFVLRNVRNDARAQLVNYDERSFFQNNNDVTRAVYRIKGYRWDIVMWWDNKTGERIA